MKFIAVTLFILAVVASCDTTTPRPAPTDPNANWIKYCSEKTDCGLCASQSNCAWCPSTNSCVFYTPVNLGAKLTCPALVNQPAACK